MSLHIDSQSTFPTTPLAVEFGALTVALVCLALWARLVRGVLSTVVAPSVDGGLLATGLVSGLLSLVGLLLFAGAYARIRDADVGRTLPAASDLPALAAAALTPLLFVAATKLVGVATGVPYTALTKTAVAADAPLGPLLLVAGLGLLVGVPALVVTCQLLVQGSAARVVDGDAAVVLTTLVAGFLLVGDAGGLATLPDRGRLAGVAVFAVLLGAAAFAGRRANRNSQRYAAVAPALAFVVLSGVAGVDTLAGGLFALAQLATLAVAAAAYDRTDSLLVPAVAYASLLLANRTVVVVFEAGLRGW
ncbi:hypothetical protein [Haloplanus natans]|uniref:hypothetical protein n=1 Tax=Haloplanus natans TaxID=376171 RepID=UPI000677BEEB|nr:hypothetical protein [Haloplanus natans]